MNRPIWPILTLKLVVMAMSLEPSEKGDKLGNLRSNTYHVVNIGPVNPEVYF